MNSIGISPRQHAQRVNNPERYPAKQLKALEDVVAMIKDAKSERHNAHHARCRAALESLRSAWCVRAQCRESTRARVLEADGCGDRAAHALKPATASISLTMQRAVRGSLAAMVRHAQAASPRAIAAAMRIAAMFLA